MLYMISRRTIRGFREFYLGNVGPGAWEAHGREEYRQSTERTKTSGITGSARYRCVYEMAGDYYRSLSIAPIRRVAMRDDFTRGGFTLGGPLAYVHASPSRHGHCKQ